MKDKLIVLTGPTAVGKTSLSLKLAKAVCGEIISGDSMQIYKGMDIGTAKIMPEEMDGVVHHLIDCIEPNVSYDAFTFKEMAKPIVSEIIKNGKTPVICGGTGFYIQALAYDIDFNYEADLEYRNKLQMLSETKGSDYLYELLKECDGEYAEITPKENVKRVIRALEFFHTTGEKLSEHNKIEGNKESPYDLKYFVLTKNRETLYRDIDLRVDIMIKDGLVEEAKRLYESKTLGPTAIKAIGYRELIPYFKGEYDLERAIYLIKLDTRHFAKRQLTWFKRERDVIQVNKDEFKNEDEILEFLLEKINE